VDWAFAKKREQERLEAELAQDLAVVPLIAIDH
jgi:hypothetical protein